MYARGGRGLLPYTDPLADFGELCSREGWGMQKADEEKDRRGGRIRKDKE